MSTRSSSACRGCCRGWISASPTSSASRRPSSPTTRSSSCSATSSTSAATRSRSTARRPGTASRSCPAPGSTTSSPGCPGRPGFPDPEARAVSATCGGIRVVSVYVPNGREPGSDHYQYKLAWLASLREMVAAGPSDTIVCGDMNIAPTDEDVFDPEAYVGQTHVTAARARGAGRARGARPARRRPRSLARRARVHLLGLPRRDVPPGPRDADRPRARQRRASPTASRRPGSTARRARAAARATTRR